ncbi:MAG: hypothetical protein AMXMBFR47_06730 [Planctomycetota bacterium]
MDAIGVVGKLQEIAASGDFLAQSSKLVDEWSKSTDAFEAVEPILMFMESNPGIEFGSPGPLVHFIERFHQRGYEEKLLESIERNPTRHTVWMLNRLINGTSDPSHKQRLVEALRGVRRPGVDSRAFDAATRFLERLSL